MNEEEEPFVPDEWDEGDRQYAMRKDDDAAEYFAQKREQELGPRLQPPGSGT